MYQGRVDLDDAIEPVRNGFPAARAKVIEQLGRAGLRRSTGETLVDEWLRSTQMLPHFQAAPDFWNLAYQFAVEEDRRRAQGRLTWLMVPDRR